MQQCDFLINKPQRERDRERDQTDAGGQNDTSDLKYKSNCGLQFFIIYVDFTGEIILKISALRL